MTDIGRKLVWLVPVAAVLLLAWLARRQIAPAAAADDFSDLRVERREMPDEKNFRLVLEEAAAPLPSGVLTRDWGLLVRQATFGGWDAGAISTALVQSAEARVSVTAGLAVCEGYAGRGERADSAFFTQSSAHMLANAWRLSYEDALHRGDVVAAYDLLCEGLRTLELLFDAPDDAYDLNVAILWFGRVAGACEKLLHHPGCRAEWLAELSRRLPRQETLSQAGARAIRGQFGLCLNELESGAAVKALFGPWGSMDRWNMRMMRSKVQMRPTRQLIAEAFRRHVGVVESGRADAAYFVSDYGGGISAVISLAHPNAGGRSVANNFSMLTRHMMVSPVKAAESGAACLRALVACEQYRRKIGIYPDTLEALVPMCLDAVPKDTFSGGTLCYSRERGVLWAVGENVGDDGGSTRTQDGGIGHYRATNPRYALDMVFPVSSNAYEKAVEEERVRVGGRRR